MSKSGGINLLVEQAQDIVGSQIRSAFDRDASRYGSPIEALFDKALQTLYRLEPPAPDEAFILPIVNKDQFRSEHYGYLVLYSAEQVRCLDWPVDFLIAAQDYNGFTHFAVVECDGHEFHERTKDQAQRDRSRDRRLQEAGFRVFRFTGSELYRDPIGCAREVIGWAATVWQIGLPS